VVFQVVWSYLSASMWHFTMWEETWLFTGKRCQQVDVSGPIWTSPLQFNNLLCYLASVLSGAKSHASLISPALLSAAALRLGADIIWIFQSWREMEGKRMSQSPRFSSSGSSGLLESDKMRLNRVCGIKSTLIRTKWVKMFLLSFRNM